MVWCRQFGCACGLTLPANWSTINGYMSIDTLLLFGLFVLVAVVLMAIAVLLFPRPPSTADLSLSLQNVSNTVQQGQTQDAVLAGKLESLGPLAEAVGSVQIELRRLSERVSRVEQLQNYVGQGIGKLGSGLVQAGTLTQGLVDATGAMRADLSRAKDDLRVHKSITSRAHQAGGGCDRG